MTVPVYDLRALQADPPHIVRGGKAVKKHKVSRRTGKVVRRDLDSITGVTLHQTAVEFSPRRHELYDHDRALAERALDVAAHAVVFRPGFIALPNPTTWYVYHANRLNACDVGVEIDGRYPGLEAQRTTRHTELTDGVVETARAAVELLAEECPELRFIHAHRQSSATRRADPGEAIWRAVVVDYAVPVLGLQVESERTWRHRLRRGRAIPREWDPGASARY